MQKLISKYGLAAHLALVAVAPLFLSPTAVLWLSFLGLLWLMMEPSRFGSEMLHQARFRVTRAIVTDPLFWVSLGLVIVSLIRLLNTGVALSYDVEATQWVIAEPTFALMPGSVEGGGSSLLACAVSALVVMQGCRHGLGRSARGAFALVASALSGLGAAVWVYLYTEGNAEALSAAECTFLNPVYSGSAYGLFLILAVTALVSSFEFRWYKAMPLAVLGIAGNSLGLFVFAPAVVIAGYGIVLLLVLIYSFVYLHVNLGKSAEFKLLVFIGLGLTLAVLAVLGCLPSSFSSARIEPFMTGAFIPEGYFEVRRTLSALSTRIWKESPWLGTGYGSFALSLQFFATPEDWQVVQPLQKAVPNGYWMLLIERGIVGAFFLAVPVVLLLITYVRRAVRGVRLALPHPLAILGFVLFLFAVAEMLFDASYMTSGAVVALAAVLSVSAASFPKEMSQNGR